VKESEEGVKEVTAEDEDAVEELPVAERTPDVV